MKIPKERIAEIKAAEKAATEGPWTTRYEQVIAPNPTGKPSFSVTWSDGPVNQDIADAVFIALARTAIPELLAERVEREEEIERLEKAVARRQAPAITEMHRKERLNLETRATTAESATAALREEVERLESEDVEPPAWRFGRQFTCPECGSHEWGTSGCTGPEEDMIGHCHAPRCRFHWSRQDDDKYMIPAKP